MYWLVGGLLVLGAICGASIRLMAFVVVLILAVAVGITISVAQGAGPGLLNALVAIVTLQAGYAAGLVLRAAIRSLQKKPRAGPAGARSAR